MGKKILLADDSLTIQKVVELTLSGTDYELTSVSNGRKALESLQASRPDLILADVVMPEKNGYEVCEAVKGDPDTARIPVVLLSGTFEPFDRERAERIGCDLVVSKPFDSHQLLERIDALLERAPSRPREEQAPFETASPDDTVPSAGPRDSAEAESPFGREEEAPSIPPDASRETSALPPPTPPSSQSAPPPALSPERHPVEDARVRTPPPEPPAPPASFLHEVAFEEISAEAAEVLFDLPYEIEPAPPAAGAPAASELTEAQIDRIAARVVQKLSDRIVREIAWEVVPEMAEMVVKRRIKELESGAE